MPPVTTAETQAQEQSAATSAMLKERRFKLSRACDRCRRRRIKCDEGHPCQACIAATSACTFEEPGKRTHPHKSKRTTTLEDRMQHLETLIAAIPPAVFAANGAMAPGPPAADSPASPLAPFMYSSAPHSGVPPPSLHVFPLTNPSSRFTVDQKIEERRHPLATGGPFQLPSDQLADEGSRMSLTASYLYFDDEGYTRWQGETSGLPVLDLLVETHTPVSQHNSPDHSAQVATAVNTDWFPDRKLQRTDVNPQALWRLITSSIAPDLMDNLVQCFLSTSYYILPFLHVPTFLADYGNPQKWSEPGFGAFIVAVCCLASRHMDDPRVRADPNNGISSGSHWFELFGRLKTLPIADRPTLYNIQANLIAAVYGVGLGKLSKAASYLAEACTMCIDAGLHRSADTYDLFDPIEDEVRKRTFWCIYIWDKQLGAHFGRPSMIRLRDCDVPEPAPVDDEYITREAIGVPPPGTECRISAFIVCLRIMVVLEAVLDVPPARKSDERSSFLSRASVLTGVRKFKEMREEEALLDEIHQDVPPYWSHSPETLASEDTIRLTQAERLYCAEQFVRLLIYRHRFSELVAERTSGPVPDEQTEAEKEALVAAHNAGVQIVVAHVNIAKKGLMTYYGVHVIHQLTQAGRTLVAVLLCCKTEALQHLIPPGLDALRSCIGLLRRFSGRYVCGLRSGDLMEEFCRLTNIPLETSRMTSANTTRPPWIRPVRKKAPSGTRSSHSGDSPSQHSSPEAFSPSDFFVDSVKSGLGPGPSMGMDDLMGDPSATSSTTSGAGIDGAGAGTAGLPSPSQMYMSPEILALFNGGMLDMNQLFSNEFMQMGPTPPTTTTNGALPPQQNGVQQLPGGQVGSPNEFLKMGGLVASP